MGPSIIQTILQGTWTKAILGCDGCMLLLSLIGAILLAASLFSKTPLKPALIGFGIVLMLNGLIIAALGVGGYFSDLSLMEQALSAATPENREEMEAYGRSFANTTLTFGLVSSVLPGLLGLALLARGLTQKTDPHDI